MREILFRGKDKDGNWIEGDLIHGVGYKKGNMYILPIVENLAYIPNCHPIDGVKVVSETVGQFTGLTDKNGVKIFEGDIYKDSWGKLSIVEFFYADEHKTSGHGSSDRIIIVGLKLDFAPKHIEVIGNIHDNQELLNQ